jgi:hypothetical protein
MTGLGNVVQIGKKPWLSLPAAAVLIAGTGVLLPHSASAAQASHVHGALTVSTKGSDTGNCQRHSCKTLGYALTQAQPNSTIIIFPPKGSKGSCLSLATSIGRKGNRLKSLCMVRGAVATPCSVWICRGDSNKHYEGSSDPMQSFLFCIKATLVWLRVKLWLHQNRDCGV